MVRCVLGLFTSFAYWRVAWSTLAFIALFIDHIVLGFLHCLEDTNQICLLLYFDRVEHFMKPSFKKATNSDTSVLGRFGLLHLDFAMVFCFWGFEKMGSRRDR